MNRKRKFLWFLFGLGGRLQLFGTSLCFTELFVYGAALVLASSEWPYMKRNGVTTFFWLSIGVVINAALACLVNHTEFAYVLRGMAVVCLLPCAIVVGHWMLRKDMASFNWMIVGSYISGILSTFIFQSSVQVAMNAGGVRDENTAAAIMNGPLWLVGIVGGAVMLYPKGWYMKCPRFLSVGLTLFTSFFALFTTVSGRAVAVRGMCSAALVMLGGKRPSDIRRRISKQFWALCALGLILIFGFKTFYQTAAESGWLGEQAQKKYEMQTKGDKSLKALLLGGRMESFCGLVACVDNPIIGFGPWAIDSGGYKSEFLAKYGNAEDYEEYERRCAERPDMRSMIPCHAYITEFWCWYGIMGLVFWLYVIYVFIRYLRQDCYAVPHWFMWLACGIPGVLWDMFFSPFSSRVGTMMFVVAILMVRAVRKGIQPLPYEMVREIERG